MKCLLMHMGSTGAAACPPPPLLGSTTVLSHRLNWPPATKIFWQAATATKIAAKPGFAAKMLIRTWNSGLAGFRDLLLTKNKNQHFQRGSGGSWKAFKIQLAETLVSWYSLWKRLRMRNKVTTCLENLKMSWKVREFDRDWRVTTLKETSVSSCLNVATTLSYS